MKRLAVVGAGGWGRNLVRNFVEILGADRVTVCDANAGTLAAQPPGVRKESDFDRALSDAEAVVIATPAPTHFALAHRALKAGKHVLVEKPISLTSEEARTLADEARRADRRLMVDHLLLYHPAVREMKRIVEAGTLGDLYYLYGQRLNLGVVRTVENALWSLGSHDVSVFLHLVDAKPVSVSAHGAVYLQKDRGIEDVAFLHLTFANGVQAHTHVSWLDPHKVRRFTVVGSERMLVFDDMLSEEKLVVHNRRMEKPSTGRYVFREVESSTKHVEEREPVREMCTHFIECVRDGREPISGPDNGLAVLRVLESAQRSILEGGRAVELA